MNSLWIRGREPLHSASRVLFLGSRRLACRVPENLWSAVTMRLIMVTFTKCHGGHRCRSYKVNDLCAVVADRSGTPTALNLCLDGSPCPLLVLVTYICSCLPSAPTRKRQSKTWCGLSLTSRPCLLLQRSNIHLKPLLTFLCPTNPLRGSFPILLEFSTFSSAFLLSLMVLIISFTIP